MFFSPKQFADLVGTENAEVIAKFTNDIMEKKGRVLFGQIYDGASTEDKRDVYKDFSTTMKPDDTHKLIVLKVGELATFDDEDHLPLKREKATESELLEMMKQNAMVLNNEIKSLRSRSDE